MVHAFASCLGKEDIYPLESWPRQSRLTKEYYFLSLSQSDVKLDVNKGAGKCRNGIQDSDPTYPAFLNRPARVSDNAGRRGCIEHEQTKNRGSGLT